MAIIDFVVIPVGTQTPSISKYVAEVQTILERYKQQGDIDYTLTPMNTQVEGDLSTLLSVIEEVHEVPFKHEDINRVSTNIRIDDRRDKQRKMIEKIDSVNKHL
ncbi:MTH1187 family thiamine-binding protein [Abyssicoccus albus]|uniref:Uncharacterized protein (TIGR00106 family) n=1 Tax=Abyssicoccus albus TaxID=1817405 RepID=A0A3N5BSR8_9BACL|nr:MTH1187 family thiamine-binding protein [Abyssicoccus albus]RPF58100.1 uncharacterized protein (TIGR00106 family) [Abyssicoccus albus]